MTKPKTISKKPIWFDTKKYQGKVKLTPLHWYWELSIRKSYRDLLISNRNGLDSYTPFHRLRKNAFATLGADPIIPNWQLKTILKKDIWGERGYKSHSARLTTCLDVFNFEIREDIEQSYNTKFVLDDESNGNPEVTENTEYNEDYQLHDTPVDLQYSDIDSLNLAHLTINLSAPNSMLKEDIWKIVEALRKDFGSNAEVVNSKRRSWSASNVLEHIDIFLAEIQQGKEFKASERVKWIQPNSDSPDTTKASKNEKTEALKLLDDQILHQLYIESYSAENKQDLDRQ